MTEETRHEADGSAPATGAGVTDGPVVEPINDLVARAAGVVSERRLTQWQEASGSGRPVLVRNAAIAAGIATVCIVLLIAFVPIEVGIPLAILPAALAWWYVDRLFSANKEANLARLLARQAGILGLTYEDDPPGSAPEFIRRHQYLLPGFEGHSGFQAGFRGAWRGVELAMAEFYVPGDDEDAPEWGLIVALAMNTRLRSPVSVTGDSGRLINAIARKLRGNHLPLDNDRFEARYEVFTDDDRRARRLLTDDFVKLLLRLPPIDGDPPASMVFAPGFIMFGYLSDEDIFPAFAVRNKQLQEIKAYAWTNARAMATPHRIIEILDLPPNGDGLSTALGEARSRAAAEEAERKAAESTVTNISRFGV